jgi:histidinol-phosphatase (PHP family)
MRFSNFHTHSLFCDGKGAPEEYVKKAIELNFSAIGFSSHAPMELSSAWNMRKELLREYIYTINLVREKYKKDIEVYCGLEVDFIPGITGPKSKEISDLNLDYVLGSVHYIKNEATGEYLTVDGSDEDYKRIINEFFRGDVQNFIKTYYTLIRSMIKEHRPDIVGHLDLIKKNNKDSIYFSEEKKSYHDEVIETLKIIREADCILEINTGGISRGYMSFPYPSSWILRLCKEMNIKLTLNADAHSPENLNTYFKESIEALKEIGYEKLYTLEKGVWHSVEI